MFPGQLVPPLLQIPERITRSSPAARLRPPFVGGVLMMRAGRDAADSQAAAL